MDHMATLAYMDSLEVRVSVKRWATTKLELRGVHEKASAPYTWCFMAFHAAKIRCQDLWALASGNSSPQAAFAQGKISVRGTCRRENMASKDRHTRRFAALGSFRWLFCFAGIAPFHRRASLKASSDLA